jgi:hypothetical protein
MIELLKTLLESTLVYVAKRIHSDKDKYAYIKAMSKCCLICSKGEDIYAVRRELEYFSHDARKTLKRSWLGGQNRHYFMAIEHAIEATDSIILRFVRGYSSEESNNVSVDILEGQVDGHQVSACMERVSAVEG